MGFEPTTVRDFVKDKSALASRLENLAIFYDTTQNKRLLQDLHVANMMFYSCKRFQCGTKHRFSNCPYKKKTP